MPEDQRSFFEQLRDVPLVSSSEVTTQWVAIASQREPWRFMPADDFLGELTGVVSAFLREVPRDGARRPNLLELAARRHGSFRRRQGMPGAALAEESNMLLEAFFAVLAENGVSEAMAEAIVALLGRNLRLIRRSMSAGYLDGPSCPRS
jgi:hypothetical protein